MKWPSELYEQLVLLRTMRFSLFHSFTSWHRWKVTEEKRLRSSRFQKKSRIFLKSLSKESIFWVGLNTSRQLPGKRIGVNPTVEITFKPIEDIFQKIMKSKAVRPTLASSLGYLMPEQRYSEWVFHPTKRLTLSLNLKK